MIHLSSRALDVERWSRGEVPGEIVKQNRGRTVWRVPAGSPALYVKRFPPSLFRDRARKEADMLRALEAVGIPCPKLVGLARDRSGSYLLTEEIVGARELLSLLPGAGPSKHALLASFGRLARRLHDRNIEHLDFHAGNVLVKGDEFYVLDVHRARRGRLSRAHRLDGLAFAAMSFLDLVPATGFVRFLRAYGVTDRDETRDVCRRLQRRRHLHFRGREGRCLKDGSGFGIRDGVYYRKGIDLDAILAAARSGGRVVKETGGESLVRVSDGLFVKRTARSRALRIWKNAHGFAVRGLPTPRLQACGPGWVAGEWIDAPNLGDVAVRDWSGMGREARSSFLGRLARSVRKLHDRGAYHQDLKSSNILVAGSGFHYIDLDRVRFSASVSGRDRTFNLAQLNASVSAAVTRTDRLRFLRAYIGADRALWLGRKSWAAEIMKATRARRHVWPPR